MSTDVLFIVPARAGSKRLPGKNTMDIGGRTLVDRTAATLERAGYPPSRCLLTTDDPMVADQGRAAGWCVPWLRPTTLAADETATLDVILHALDWWLAEHRREPDILVLLQLTTPFRNPAHLTEALARLATQPALDAVIGISDLHRSEATLFRAGIDGRLEPLGQPTSPAPIVTPNGALYAVRTKALRRERTFFPRASTGLLMGRIASIDIDTAEDMALARAIAAAGLEDSA